MAKRDFYEVLGVSKTADADELKRAYRKLAMSHHPDRNPGDKSAEQKFKEINEAYDVLKDDQKRAAYDRYGHAAFENGGRGPGDFGFGGGFSGGFADIFEEMFGAMGAGRRAQAGPARGSDLRYNLEVSLEDAFKGKQTTIRVATFAHCDTCQGSGAEPGTRPISCRTCHGHGQGARTAGFLHDRAHVPDLPRHRTDDRETVQELRRAGARRARRRPSRSTSRRASRTVRASGWPARARSARTARRRATFIFSSASRRTRSFSATAPTSICRVPIPFTTAALGGAIEVPTVDGGRTRVTVPAGTQYGHQFRLRGKGMPVLRSAARGDMYIQAVIETPVNLTKHQQELLREFEKAGEKEKTNPESEGFFARVKEFFEDLRE